MRARGRAPDTKELEKALAGSLKAALEPEIRANLRQEMNHDWLQIFAAGQNQLREELYRQFRNDLNEFAVGTFAASSAETNRLLTALTESIGQAQLQERRLITTFLEQMELQRLQEDARLRDDLALLAAETEDELVRTRQNFAELLVSAVYDNRFPNVPENPNQSNERSPK